MKQILLMIAVVVLTGAVVTLAGCVGNKSSSKPVDWSKHQIEAKDLRWLNKLLKPLGELGRGHKK